MNYMTAYNKSTGLGAGLIRLVGNGFAPNSKKDRKLCILNYHRVLESPDPLLDSEPDIKIFQWQMKVLADSFNVLPLAEGVRALTEGALPPRAVCITFDDGYRSSHDFALPILKRFNLSATVFVTSGYMSQSNMWNDRILESVRRLSSGVLDLQEIGLGIHPIETLADQNRAVSKLMETSKYLSPDARMEVIGKLEDLAGNAFPHQLMLTKEMISTLAQQGIEIGGHTISHPILTSLDDEAARQEISLNKNHLEAIIGTSVRMFAYPNGKIGRDFDERHIQMVKDAGYLAAFTTARGAATGKHDLYQLPRSRPWDATPFLFGMRLLSWF